MSNQVFLYQDDRYDIIHDERLSAVVKELDRAVDLAKGQPSSPGSLSALRRHTHNLELLLQKANDP